MCYLATEDHECACAGQGLYNFRYGILAALTLTTSSALFIGVRSAVDTVLADSECYGLAGSDVRMSCFVNKALVNVGGELAKVVLGRVSTEVDACLAYDTHSIVRKHAFVLSQTTLSCCSVYSTSIEYELFNKACNVWVSTQGIEASRVLESEGIQTHLTFVYRCETPFIK
ncbi:uncharacterized protein LOC114271998 [Camellia sinensis]|uniref:uncharacterized protein LOC114271998 n=1 Tax=Camellia sinensis TaxID=4442 RepID=UPI001036BE72|nr:uncharacterized protein LOC114271998 [Camellia sinensis]